MKYLTQSVGKHGGNHKADVKVVQALLNMQLSCYLLQKQPLEITGRAGADTREMIAAYETIALHMEHPDEVVSPVGKTLKELRKLVTSTLTKDKLHAIMTSASNDQVDQYFQPLVDSMAAYSINTPLRVAHFLAQLGTESGEFRYTEEIASGAAYEGRVLGLGNTEKGDGKRFKGRGLIQVTGRAAYTAYGLYKNQDFLTGDNPKLLATDPALTVDSACWFWSIFKKGLNDLADADKFGAVTHKVNGGTHGLEDRRSRLARAKCLLVV